MYKDGCTETDVKRRGLTERRAEILEWQGCRDTNRERRERNRGRETYMHKKRYDDGNRDKYRDRNRDGNRDRYRDGYKDVSRDGHRDRNGAKNGDRGRDKNRDRNR